MASEQIFYFNDQNALTVQSEQACTQHFSHIHRILLQETSHLRNLGQRLTKATAKYQIYWVPRYGCAVCFGNVNIRLSSVFVIGLDGWTEYIHASISGRERTALADVWNPAVLELGTVPSNACKSVWDKLLSELSKRECQQSSSKNHKTPSFVAAALWDVLIQLKYHEPYDSSVVAHYQGSTTDVGLHTRCLRRNTSFPLVLSVIQMLLRFDGCAPDDGVFPKCVCIYFLHWLFEHCEHAESYDPRSVDRGIAIIRAIEEWVLKVEGDEQFQRLVITKVKAAHDQLKALKPKLDLMQTELQVCDSLEQEFRGLRSPSFPDIPDFEDRANPQEKLALARAEAKRNLNWSSISSPSLPNDSWLVLAQLNSRFWDVATKLHDFKQRDNIKDMVQWLDLHSRATSAALTMSNDSTFLMSVVLSSCHMLATWICFCSAQRSALQNHPVFKDYSAALNPQDLMHLVLNDSRAIRAARCVQAFLTHHRLHSKFPFRNVSDTLELALVFGRNSPRLCNIHDQELSSANSRIEQRYQKILEKQQRLADLDPQLRNAEVNLSAARKARERSEGRDFHYDSRRGHKVYEPAYYTYKSKENECESEVSSLKSAIRSLEGKPDDLFLPLPRGKDESLRWLFFLYMPHEFIALLLLAHRAESILWVTCPVAPHPKHDLFYWFSRYKTVSESPVSLLKMTLGSMVPEVSNLHTPGIREYSRETGVFFPDSYAPRAFWIGTDPFIQNLRKETDTVVLFTELLPSCDGSKALQKFLPMLPDPTRGNEGIAQKNAKPDWLSHEEYLAFCALRAFPNCQIRQLLVSMADNLLPFENGCIRVLVQQMLFHIGEESWKTDFDDSKGFRGLELFSMELELKAEILCESPKNSGKLALFGIVSAFLGQFHDGCRQCASRFSRIARKLADDIQEEVKNRERVDPSAYWKQAKLYGIALLCHSVGERGHDTLLQITELIVLFANKSLFSEKTSERQELERPIQQLMAMRISELVALSENKPELLTHCLRLVLDKVPVVLKWTQVKYGHISEVACFEAAHDHLYSINLLNGTVLVDGFPPGLLPHSVTSNSLFLRTFGPRNFESIVLGANRFRTARVIDERFLYEFNNSGCKLCIYEFDASPGVEQEKLFLLRQETMDLPILLQNRYSHWFSSRKHVVVLRGPTYKERRVEYIMTPNNTYIVPYGYQMRPVDCLLQSCGGFERIVLGEARPSVLFRRIEHAEFVHLAVNADATALRYTLPRSGLEFEHTDEGVKSINFSGFCLRQSQILEGTLAGMTSYIILEDRNGHEVVLVPAGELLNNGSICIPSQWDQKTEFYVYDVHQRFKRLQPREILGRLQLAGMYAASASYLAEARTGKDGMSLAIELVRQCWTNEPLEDSVRKKLIEVSKLSQLSCTLRLMCSWIWTSSNSVRFLHTESDQPVEVDLHLDPLAIQEYRMSKYAPRLNPTEEHYLLGTLRPTRMSTPLRRPQVENISLLVNDIEGTLKKFLRPLPAQGASPFPLRVPKNCSALGTAVYRDLLSSWDAYCSLQIYDVGLDRHQCAALNCLVRVKREENEAALLSSLMENNDDVDYRMKQLCGMIRPAVPLDLICMAWDEALILEFIPMLNDPDSLMDLRLAVIDWMLLCALEDKLRRLLGSQNRHDLVAEVQSSREWDPYAHPRWLAFEVEQMLGIRPCQYAIVQRLLDCPGSVIQLNMGQGKTSVLVPMLLLELSQRKSAVVRINMLRSIIHVMAELHRSLLVASVQHIKIFTMPFERSLPLEDVHARILSQEISHCREDLGCLLVAPQDRCSLILKQHDSSVFVEGLKDHFIDVIDESDAILDHSYQLVYAVGDQQPLPGGPSRWTMLGVFLKMLALNECTEIAAILANTSIVHREVSSPGSFPHLRLLPGFNQYQETVGPALCRQLVTSPPYEFIWMRRVISHQKVELLVAMMSDFHFSDCLEAIRSDPLLREFESDILAARGCIAYGILFHAMSSRHRVHYGIGDSGKKMAVPFEACDTPKARSEYSHPDMAIAYTCLSYLHEGLSKCQFKEALSRLQDLGLTAQESVYAGWIASVKDGIDPLDLSKFDTIWKVDADNQVQLDLMYHALHRCMEMVIFWMNNYVFPEETYQFPYRRVTSAWNLADSGEAIGFSGTDDNRFLLPLDIEQIPPPDDELKATNGAMIDCIIQRTQDLRVLVEDGTSSLWKVVLHQCLSLGTRALIDVGGLMAGVENQEAAMYLAEQMLDSDNFRGIAYFEPSLKTWYVFELKDKRHQALRASSLSHAECFVYFDESRCRGSDMRLQLDAVALVTLAPKLTKDKFLQGCARMRKLRADGQSIILAGTGEVLSSESTATSVLDQIVRNTIEKNRKGLVQWFERGMDHEKFPELLPTYCSLEYMYSRALKEYGSLESYLNDSIEHDATSERAMELVKHCKEIGSGIDVNVSQLSEECERELEHEEEREEEKEEQLKRQTPHAEEDWKFVLAFSDPGGLFSSFFLRVADLVSKSLGEPLCDIQWNTKLYCTPNFWETVQNCQNFSRYLRPVNTILAAADGRVVLISEYEADKLLPIWWELNAPAPFKGSLRSGRIVSRFCQLKLQHVCTAISNQGFGGDVVDIPTDVRTSLKLFRGYVNFDSGEIDALSEVFTKPNVRSAVQHLLRVRERLRFLDRSDLDLFSLGSRKVESAVLSRHQPS